MLLLLSTVVEPRGRAGYRGRRSGLKGRSCDRCATAMRPPLTPGLARPWSGRQHAGQPGIRHVHGCRGLAVEPGFVALVEVVVVGESAFEAGQCGGPDVEGVGGLLKGQLLGRAYRPECSGVGAGSRVEELVVDFPGDVALEAAHDFLGALAFLVSPGHIGPGPGVVSHPHEDHAVDGFVGLPVAAAAEPVTGGLSR